jgi:protein involved in polysaccharide export with SLBB domain
MKFQKVQPLLITAIMLISPTFVLAANQAPCVDIGPQKAGPSDYIIGSDDILTISVLQPDQMINDATVSPDGNISVSYIGNVIVKGRTLAEVQKEIQTRLGDGYMKYPTVVVALKTSNSRRFFVYGEVTHPGPYPLEENTTVLRAISMAEGFTRFGSASRVKILKARKKGTGYMMVPLNINAIMNGDCNADLVLESGDIVVVSEGVF